MHPKQFNFFSPIIHKKNDLKINEYIYSQKIKMLSNSITMKFIMKIQDFIIVFITKFNDRASKYICDYEKGYKQYLKENPDMCENIGEYGQQIKPVFDVDAYEAEPDINEIISQ